MIAHKMNSQDQYSINILLNYNFIVKERKIISRCNNESLHCI